MATGRSVARTRLVDDDDHAGAKNRLRLPSSLRRRTAGRERLVLKPARQLRDGLDRRRYVDGIENSAVLLDDGRVKGKVEWHQGKIKLRLRWCI